MVGRLPGPVGTGLGWAHTHLAASWERRRARLPVPRRAGLPEDSRACVLWARSSAGSPGSVCPRPLLSWRGRGHPLTLTP